MKRTPIENRKLPRYTKGEEVMNMVTHISGGGLAILGAAACLWRAILGGSALAVVCAAIYGFSMIGVYAMSSIYHGLRVGMGKKVMQVLDHCMIYFLIAGTYTPVALCAIRPSSPFGAG